MNAFIFLLMMLAVGLLVIQEFFNRVYPRIVAEREAEAQRKTELRNRDRSERAAAELRAWEALEPMLSLEQLLQKEKYGYILERGSLGYYIIPMRRKFVLFQAHVFTDDDLSIQQIHAGKNTNHLRQVLMWGKYCSICLSDTGPQAPWYDAVATILYTIRDGNEIVIFKEGDIRGFNLITDPSHIPSLLELLNVTRQKYAETAQREDA